MDMQHAHAHAHARRLQAVRFNAILCDVPCSGDGTLRKSHRNTPDWSAAAGAALHVTQLKLLRQV